jgi:hypothetical protein
MADVAAGLPGLSLLARLATIDPAPFFVLSLLPYLAFLWSAGRVEGFPRLALRGFQLTLLFVAVTIAASIVALQTSGRQLADVDGLHGGAEAFLTLANLLVAVGFSEAARQSPPADGTGGDPMNKS